MQKLNGATVVTAALAGLALGAGASAAELKILSAGAKRQPGERCGDRSGSIELLHCDLRFVEANST